VNTSKTVADTAKVTIID